MADTTSPTLRRRRLGKALREARGRAGRTREAVAAEMGVSLSTVLRWENGTGAIRISALRQLLDFLDIRDQGERAELETLAREGRQRGWWNAYTSAIRPTFTTFLGLEAEAESEGEFSAIVIPGLLQTVDYMRAVMRAAIPTLDNETIERRIELRQERQQQRIYSEGAPLTYDAVIDEGAVRRMVGGRDVWRAQLRHLLMVCEEYRNVTLQVGPFSAGAHASMLGGFSLLTFPDAPPVAYVELAARDAYAEGDEAARYAAHLGNLRAAALPPALSAELIDAVIKG